MTEKEKFVLACRGSWFYFLDRYYSLPGIYAVRRSDNDAVEFTGEVLDHYGMNEREYKFDDTLSFCESYDSYEVASVHTPKNIYFKVSGVK